MKKLSGILLFGFLVFCMFGTTASASPETIVAPVNDSLELTSGPNKPSKVEQVIYTRKCCDGGGNVRCILENWTPVNNPCFCYGQGWGYAC